MGAPRGANGSEWPLQRHFLHTGTETGLPRCERHVASVITARLPCRYSRQSGQIGLPSMPHRTKNLQHKRLDHGLFEVNRDLVTVRLQDVMPGWLGVVFWLRWRVQAIRTWRLWLAGLRKP